MLNEKIYLWKNNDCVTLETFILNNSLEYQTNQLRPAIIICPGGAYLGTSDREAEPVALRFASLGYHTFVLRYTTYFKEWVQDFTNLPEPMKNSRYPQPLFDLAKAILTVRENAEKWHVDPNKIIVSGFSAGAHLAASMGVRWNSGLLNEKFEVENEQLKPNAVLLGYPLLDYQLMKEKVVGEADEMTKGLWIISNTAVFGTPDPSPEQIAENSPIKHVSEQTPPTFIWHTADDALVYVENSIRFAGELAKHKVSFELHIFENGVHGLSLSDETTAGEPIQINHEAAAWVDLAKSWLNKHFR